MIFINKYGVVMSIKNVRRWLSNHISINNRLLDVSIYYLLFLVATTGKKSIKEAERFSVLDKSQFSRFLKRHPDKAVLNLQKLSRKQAKQFSRALRYLSDNKLPWKIAILIDSTIQHRSYRHTQNAQRFNHGQGFVIGHQWTNIVLFINDTMIPLPPIAFHTKKYCRTKKIKYKTEHESVVEYIKELDLKELLGHHRPEEVVVLADSGYDNRKIEQAISQKRWNFIIGMSKTRSVKSQKQYLFTRKSEGWSQVAVWFKNQRRIKWETVRFFVTKGHRRRRKDFRVRQIIGYLRYVGKIQLVCSESRNRPEGRRKYLACNDLKATARHIVLGYRIRWLIEIFHKEVKQYLGFEDVASKYFESVISHVHWVYCAYILLNMGPPGVSEDALTVQQKQLKLNDLNNSGDICKWRQILTQFNGTQKLMNEFCQVIQLTNDSVGLIS